VWETRAEALVCLEEECIWRAKRLNFKNESIETGLLARMAFGFSGLFMAFHGTFSEKIGF
jgi:hypothetical protein